MNLLRDIEWKLVLKTFVACTATPWALVTVILLLLVSPGATHVAWKAYVGAALVGTAYFATPAATAYFTARFAKSHPLAHAMLAVALGLVAYVTVFEESLYAIAVWPVMGALGALPFRRKPRTEAPHMSNGRRQ